MSYYTFSILDTGKKLTCTFLLNYALSHISCVSFSNLRDLNSELGLCLKPVPAQISWVIKASCLNLSEAKFSHIYNGDRNNLCLAHMLFKVKDEIRNLCKSTWKAKIFFSMLETE